MSGVVDDIIGVLVKRHVPSFKIIQLLIIDSIKHSTQHSKILHDFLTTWWNPLLMLLTLAHFVVNCNAYEYWQISQKCYRCLNTVKLEEQDCMASNSTVTTTLRRVSVRTRAFFFELIVPRRSRNCYNLESISRDPSLNRRLEYSRRQKPGQCTASLFYFCEIVCRVRCTRNPVNISNLSLLVRFSDQCQIYEQPSFCGLSKRYAQSI